MRIAVIGLGKMGHALAERLLDTGHELSVWNRTADRATDLGDRARVAPSAAAAAQGAEVVITMLADDGAVRDVVLGGGGVLEALGGGSVLVDMSTVSPLTTAQLAEAVPGGRFVAAPILAGPAAVRSGEGSLLLGGDVTRIASLDPLWSQLAARWEHCGDAAQASVMKLAFNLIGIAGLTAACEAVVLAQRAGVDNATLTGLFERLPVVPPSMRARIGDVIGGTHLPSLFDASLAEKDLRLAVELGRVHELRLEVAGAAREMMARAAELGLGDRDMAAVVEAVRDQR